MDEVKILVVDDEAEICGLTKSILSKKGYNVLTAATAAEALKIVKEERPQVVLLDILLGADSGMDVLAKIKEMDKSIKVIMITALDDDETILKAKSQGADDYISKPFTATYLNELTREKISSLGLGK
ncbi:MAG: response regulator [Candidatus Omnitrophica bacterium]|nr:response regulator [Candidatus Omnitrophota bacterium]